jgi:hypothetical protein
MQSKKGKKMLGKETNVEINIIGFWRINPQKKEQKKKRKTRGIA